MSKKEKLIKQKRIVEIFTEMLMNNASVYIQSLDNESVFCDTVNNSNVSKTALKAQITTLRKELFKLSQIF